MSDPTGDLIAACGPADSEGRTAADRKAMALRGPEYDAEGHLVDAGEETQPDHERWLPVVGWEAHYEVSDLGRVRRIAGGMGATPGRILSSHPDENGYPRVQLWRNDKPTLLRVHRLVMAAFDVEPEPGQEVRHIDGIPGNVKWSNLCWGTRADNEADKVLHGRSNRGERCGTSKLTTASVLAMRRLGDAGQTFASLGRQFGVSISAAADIVKRRRWRWLEEEVQHGQG